MSLQRGSAGLARKMHQQDGQLAPATLPPSAASCIICHPDATRGCRGRRLRRILARLGPRVHLLSSACPGQTEELALQAALSGFDTVVAAGGDGTVHEAANGLMRSGKSDVVLGVLPLGSGNDYAASLNLPRQEEALVNLLSSQVFRTVDVGWVRCDNGKERWFVNTLGFCLSGAVVWETRKIRWLRGLALYGFGALKALVRHFRWYPMKFTLDGKAWSAPTLFFTLALGKREGGGFVVAPSAVLDDGCFDYLHGSQLNLLSALWYAPGLVVGQLPTHDPRVRTGRCRSALIESSEPLPIHSDGEVLSGPDQKVHRVEVKLLPQALRVRAPAQ